MKQHNNIENTKLRHKLWYVTKYVFWTGNFYLESSIFNIYMNDLCSDLLNSTNIDTPNISDLTVPGLSWADDLVLISESKEGLQQHLNVLEKYCKDWKLSVNTVKTQVVIFNKNGKLIKKEKIFYRQQGIDSVKGYKYLGIWLDCNGKFNRAMNELAKKV